MTFSGKGEVYSYTEIHAPPEGFKYIKPHIIRAIKLDERPLITAQIVDRKPEKVEIEKRVKSVFRKVIETGEAGVIQYGYKLDWLRMIYPRG